MLRSGGGGITRRSSGQPTAGSFCGLFIVLCALLVAPQLYVRTHLAFFYRSVHSVLVSLQSVLDPLRLDNLFCCLAPKSICQRHALTPRKRLVIPYGHRKSSLPLDSALRASPVSSTLCPIFHFRARHDEFPTPPATGTNRVSEMVTIVNLVVRNIETQLLRRVSSAITVNNIRFIMFIPIFTISALFHCHVTNPHAICSLHNTTRRIH